MGISVRRQRLDIRCDRATHRLGDSSLPDRYEAIAPAGEGAFCEIWQIRDRQTGELHALKRLSEHRQQDNTAQQLLRNEVHVAQEVKSPHVVKVVGSNFECRRPYAILEWIEGSTLEEQLRAWGRFETAHAVWMARQCAQGLHDLAAAGFTHGDLKPANIILSPQGEVKLIDLGFAQPLGTCTDSYGHAVMLGTAEYMAPEAIVGRNEIAGAKDIYSLGVVLFRALTGRLPFPSDSTKEVLRLQREARPPILRRWCPTAPRELAALVGRMLAKHPIRRPANSRELVRDLIDIEIGCLPARCVD